MLFGYKILNGRSGLNIILAGVFNEEVKGEIIRKSAGGKVVLKEKCIYN